MPSLMDRVTLHPRRLCALAVSVACGVLSLGLGHSAEAAAPGEKTTPTHTQVRANSRTLAEQHALHQRLNAVMGLRHSDLATIAPAAGPVQRFAVEFSYDGRIYTLDAVPYTVRDEHYQVLVQVEDGSVVNHEPGPLQTFRGAVLEIPGSDAAGSYQSDGLWAIVLKPDGERLWIEPAWRMDAGAPMDLHVVYSDHDRLLTAGDCGTLHDAIPPMDENQLNTRGGTACGSGLCFAELGNDADVEYFDDWGSVTAVENRVNSVVAAMNVQYEQDVDITHVITAIVVRTVEPDPYSSTDSATLVAQVRNEWESNLSGIPRDLAQLFTGKEINGSVVGRAFDIGVVCSDRAYSFSQSDCCGAFARTVELHAHENGHVWNGIHCSCPGFTMHTPLNSNPLGAFTAGNISRIVAHRDDVSCLGPAAGLMLPFSDDFPTTVLDELNWSLNQDSEVNDLGNGEPSPPNSLNINGSDTVVSDFIDLMRQPGNGNAVEMSYWWQRTGGGNSPEAGEDLFVEYLNELNQWVILRQHPGDGPDGDPYQFESFILPEEARHSFFRIRIRGVSPNPGFDDFFVDDVLVTEIETPELNDMCNAGNIIELEEGVPHPFDTTNSSSSGPSESLCGGDIYRDIWYLYLPDCDGDVTIGVCDADFDARIASYFVICPFEADSALACDDSSCAGGEAQITFAVNQGSTYWIRVGATNPGVTGTGSITVTCDTPVTGACCMPDGTCTPQSSADCSTMGGAYQGDGTDCGGADCPQPCPADIADANGPNPDGEVNVFDLILLLTNWNTNGIGADIAPPDDIVDVFDLVELLDSWGTCD